LTLGSTIPSVKRHNDFPMHDTKRRPISTRHAFALAFDLAVRRDALHSLLVPIVLRAPWTLTLALLPPLESTPNPATALLFATLALIGDFITLLVVGAMLRFRARSVFNAPRDVAPAPVIECYGHGLTRIPQLLATEVVRNGLLATAASCSILPTVFMKFDPVTFVADFSSNFLLLVIAGCLVIPLIFLGFRLGVATEAVVLDERGMTAAFQRSFRMMQGHFERWLELISASAALVIALALVSSLAGAWIPGIGGNGQVVLFWLLIIGATPVIQYAWTFFYLRLVEIDAPVLEVGPFYAATGGIHAPAPGLAPELPVPSQEAKSPKEESPRGGNGVPVG